MLRLQPPAKTFQQLLKLGPKAIDETGKVYGRLTVLGLGGKTSSSEWKWTCRCICGREALVIGQRLRRGLTVSCGCYGKERALAATVTHGLSHSPTHATWRGMVARATDPRDRSYARYGRVGIGVCDRWLKFENFVEDMGVRPLGKTLDRRDNSRGYSPENCRWATLIEQQANRACARIISAFGEAHHLSEWCRRTGLRHSTINARLRSGWSIEAALSTPSRRRAR